MKRMAGLMLLTPITLLFLADQLTVPLRRMGSGIEDAMLQRELIEDALEAQDA